MTNPGQHDPLESIVFGRAIDPVDVGDRLEAAYKEFDDLAHELNPHIPHSGQEMLRFQLDGEQSVISVRPDRSIYMGLPVRTTERCIFIACFDLGLAMDNEVNDATLSALVVATTLEEYTRLTQTDKARITIIRLAK
jgi:hypothetical protein